MKRRIVLLLIVSAMLLALMGCSFAELTQQKSEEPTLPDHSADSSSEATPQEVDSELPVMDTVELIGYVADSQTPWIELYESTDNKEPLAKVPYDLIAALPGCDRRSEAFPFGYLDSITFYYGEIGTFCWCVAALPPAAGTGAANVCTSLDSGETWSISDPNALYTGTVIGAGFASEAVGFISYRYFFDNGPEIARTLDGGKTWARLELDIPSEYAQYNSETNTKQNIGRGWNARPDSVEDTYPMNDSIWSRVHAMLDCGHWVPEYEDGVREFELEDSKRSDLPGDFFQWPRYYSAFVDYFSGMNADLSYLDWDSFWTKDLSEDGQTLIVTMTPGNGDHAALTLSYSLQTQEISVGDNNGL